MASANIISYAQAHQNTLPYIVFLIGFAKSLAVISLLVPGVMILVALGALAAASELSLWPLVIADGFGAILGYALSYWAGLYWSSAILHWPLLKKHPESVVRTHVFMEKYGAISVFLGHFFGPVRAFIALIAGVNAMRALPFHLANISSSFLWSFGVLAPSYYGVETGFFEFVSLWIKSLF